MPKHTSRAKTARTASCDDVFVPYRKFSEDSRKSQMEQKVVDSGGVAKKVYEVDISSAACDAKRIDLRQVISFHPASYKEGSCVVGRIFRIYKKITGGADGSVAGLNG